MQTNLQEVARFPQKQITSTYSSGRLYQNMGGCVSRANSFSNQNAQKHHFCCLSPRSSLVYFSSSL